MGVTKARLTVHQAVVLGFSGAILLGTALLALPLASRGGHAPSLLDALFTATSATCVTGLTVVDTATQYNWLGRLIILALIQVGGLGYMTMATLLALMVGRRLYIRQTLFVAGEHGEIGLGDARQMLKYIAKFTFLCEGIGALVLAARFAADFPWPRALAYGVFHSVSAFCNAGFDILGLDFGPFSSFTHYRGDPVFSLTIPLLLIAGGLGFVVFAEIQQKRQWRPLSAHSKAVLVYSAALLFFATCAFLAFESHNPQTLGGLPALPRAALAFFQAATPRTAGFSMSDQAALTYPSVFLCCVLMFIGASPGGTGGGIKTTTVAVLTAMMAAFARGREEVVHFERKIPAEVINRAVGLFVGSLALIVLVSLILMITEFPFGPTPTAAKVPLYLLFEVCSAFGTVGLSCGVTPHLTPAGRLAIIATMFAGRVGILTLLLAVAERRAPAKVHFPEGRIVVG